MTLKFYTSVVKWSKLKPRKFWGPISTFLDFTGEKLVRGLFAHPLPFWTGFKNKFKKLIAMLYENSKIHVENLEKEIRRKDNIAD